MHALLVYLWERRGTDLLLTAGTPPLVRVDGNLAAVEGESVLHPDDTEALIASILSVEKLRAFHARRELDFSFSWEQSARLRGNAFMQRGSAGLALRNGLVCRSCSSRKAG